MNIIFSIGDCNGIGLEVLLKAISNYDDLSVNDNINFSICGNEKTIDEYISLINFPAKIRNHSLIIGNRNCPIIHCGNYSKVTIGKESVSAGKLAAKSVEKAVELTLQKKFDALVTLPISKSVLYTAGWSFPGHTEMLADKCKVVNPLMILCTDKVRVGLATIHIPIKDVSKSLKKSTIVDIGKKFLNSLKIDFAIKSPKIAVLGLNPHAGESGDIGKEEINKIIPSIRELNNIGINSFGPFPADGFFGHAAYKDYDGILAMYHDQGLIPLKLLAKGAGVNFTAGLPIVRTSPDHGTAFGIAGKNIADQRSTLNAINLAIGIVENRKIIKNQYF